MAFSSSGPTTAATVVKARGSDQLDSKIDSENTKSALTPQAETADPVMRGRR